MQYVMDGASVASCPVGNDMITDSISFTLAIEVWRWATNEENMYAKRYAVQ